MSMRRRSAWRSRQVGVVFQQGELLPDLSPIDNVMLPWLWSEAGKSGRGSALARATALLEAVGLRDLPDRSDLLSGGNINGWRLPVR